MFDRYRLPPAAAMMSSLLSALLVLPCLATAGKPRDYGTATPGAPAVSTATKPDAVTSPSSMVARPDRTPVMGTSATAQITTNVALCAAASDQTTASMVVDGAGGGIVVWQDKRVGAWDIYAQRVGVGGATLWGLDGLPVCKQDGGQTNPRAVSDGAGGVIVVWQDGRAGSQGQDLYAQRISASGVEQWATGGVLVCGATGDQKLPVIVEDGQGGAVVAWLDDRAAGSDVYAQRINAAGVTQWAATGVSLCTATGVQQSLSIVTDGQRGAIAAWQDLRGGTGDIYARRVDQNGAPQWTADGVVLCTATGVQEAPMAVTDGMGGAIAGWTDSRGSSKDIYVQRVNGSGTVQWAGNGVGVCTSNGDQQAAALSTDGASGAFAAWQDARPGSQGQDVYAQRVNGSGVAQWTANGVSVCTATADQLAPAITTDPLGGMAVAWSDVRTPANGPDIYLQHLTGAGAAQWTANGVMVCDAASAQDASMVIPDGQGGAVAAWRDLRAGATPDLYSQRIDAAGTIAVACTTFTLLSASSPVSGAGPQSYFKFDQTDFYWTGVGVRSASGGDWDMEAYQPVTFGTRPYPTCFSGAVAGSFASTGVDFVVGDFNIGHTQPVFPASDAGYGARAWRYSGTGDGTVEWDSGADVITKDCGTGGSCGAKSGNNWTGVLDVWDVYLYANTTYTFDFTTTGSADIKFLLFSSVGTTGTFFLPRSERLIETKEHYTAFTAPANAFYGVVLVNDNGVAGTYTLRVVTGIPTTDVGSAPILPTGLKGVSPNPSAGRVQIDFAMREPAEAGFDVLDMAGRLVSRIPERRWDAGTWSVNWDGRTSRGTQASAGIYFVQMRVDGRKVGLGRLALVR
jgi:flagellar hook capping protein FlgD